MKVSFSLSAWREYVFWAETDRTMQSKINALVEDCVRHPFKGLGKPEPLKQNLKGYWSRRIDLANRLVYRLTGSGDDQELIIVQCRYHYAKH